MDGTGRSAQRRGWYRAVRFSPLYDWYARIIRPEYAASLAKDRVFFGKLFAEKSIRSVFDLGANVGDKARVFRELTGRVVCVEADPELVDTLQYRFRGRPGVVIDHIAVGEAVGRAVLHRKRLAGFNTLSDKWSDHAEASDIESRDEIEVPVTSLDRLIEVHGRPDYIKIDVEGFELPVVRGLSSSVRVISFEANLPFFRHETLLVIDQLIRLDSEYRFNVRRGEQGGFILPDPLDLEGIARFLSTEETVTYDVFALK